MDRAAPVRKIVRRGDLARILEVLAIRDDELDFVARREQIEIVPVHATGFATAGTLDVDDAVDAWRHLGDRDVPAGFEQDGVRLIEQALHQRDHVLLQEWLTAGDLDEWHPEVPDLGENVVERLLASLGECIDGVAPRTPEIAGG